MDPSSHLAGRSWLPGQDRVHGSDSSGFRYRDGLGIILAYLNQVCQNTVMTPVRSFSPAVENYLKAIYRLQTEAGSPVTTNALGGWLGVTASSASGMLKKLDDLRLVIYVPSRGVLLSEAGRRAALGVVRRHRLLEAFLAETLGLSWDKVHDEAEALEHALSPGLCEVIAARLGDPRTDPHGDPIPTRDGRVAETPSQNLGSLGPGQRGRVVRVSDRDPEVLRFLTGRGIALGDILEVREVRSGGGPRPPGAAADRGGHRTVAGPLARSPGPRARQGLAAAVAARGSRDPCHARGERRAEHDRLRFRRRAVRARVLRPAHPGALRDGLHLPGDVHARRRGHPPRLRRAGPAALRTGLGLVRRRRSHPDQPGHPRSRVRLHPCRAGLLPSQLRCGRRARTGAGRVHPQRRALLALGAHRARPGPLQRPVPAGGDPGKTPRGSRGEFP